MYTKRNYLSIYHSSILSVFILFSAGCIKKDEFSIQMPEQITSTIVEGYLNPELATEISITKNNLLTEELTLQSEWNANVFLTDNSETLTLLNIYYYNNNRNILMNYRNDKTPAIFGNHKIYLTIITKKGDTITGQTEKVASIRIVKAEIDGKFIRILKKVEENKFTGFLRIDLTPFTNETYYSGSTRYIDCSSLQTEEIKILLPEEIFKAESLIVKVFHIHRELYDYEISIANAKTAYYNPLLPPAAIKSNIKNATGIFTYYTFDSKRIAVK